ncbi:MLO-like protein 2 isoform X1 [Malus domestica]|uniref:MLO-like protein 2 isoform X1 n=1 Tax=Malus domestica TaxID=3750 RepID=UPI003976D6E8
MQFAAYRKQRKSNEEELNYSIAELRINYASLPEKFTKSELNKMWLTKRNKRALYEALENMLLGLLSLLLTVGQDRISDMCTSKAVEATWHPCNSKQDIKSDKGKDKSGASDDNSRRWLPSALDSSGGWPM